MPTLHTTHTLTRTLCSGAIMTCALLVLGCGSGPVIAERFVAEPYVRPDDRRLVDTLFVTLAPTLSPMTLLVPERPKTSPRYEDFRGSVAASIAAMLDEHYGAVVIGTSLSPAQHQLTLHRFEPRLRQAGTSGSIDGISVTLTTVGIDYDAELSRGAAAVTDANGSAESIVPYALGRRSFEASNLDAVERALSQMWSELSEDAPL